jgi:UPF0755 protein
VTPRRLAAWIAVGALAVAASIAAVGVRSARSWLDAPLAIEGSGITVDVPRGEPLSVTLRDLERRGVLRHARVLAAYARWRGADLRMRAGEYSLPAGTTPRGLLVLLESGAVVHHSLTIVEGWTFRDLRRAMAREPLLVHSIEGVDDAAVMAALGEPGKSPEGLFFPDTYLFDKGASDLSVLRRARMRMRDELATAWMARADGLPVGTPYEALILASIVEKETALPAERARIAGVFTERLRRGMRLQTDPTVIYGLGEAYDGNLRRSDLERDGPYNTYLRTGLPPTPIAMPGAASLAAAVRPDERGDLFFVATGLPDGSHEFSKTLAEHDRAVAKYLERYRQRTKGR